MREMEEIWGAEALIIHDNKHRAFTSFIPQSEIQRSAEHEGLNNDDGCIILREAIDYPIPQDFKEGYSTMDDCLVIMVLNEMNYIFENVN